MYEVLAYAADEAAAHRAGSATVTFEVDGSVSVVDDGRGTDTRRADGGHVIMKPIMATRDLRFFDRASAELLPDGHPRRGMSVVAALTDWLLHVNRRTDEAWQQRYERGVPATDLEPLHWDGSTGTAVRFQAGAELVALPPDAASSVATASTPDLRVDVIDRRGQVPPILARARAYGADVSEGETVTLWRPTGPQELALVEASGWREWPPRLPDQPFFSPVLNEDYATRIAREWNVTRSGAGFVTRFEVRRNFLDRYEVQQAGGETILEYWIPAEDLHELNRNIAGLIAVVSEFR